MTEVGIGVIGALTDIADVAATYLGVWLSLTFAYLTVSYFVGRALSRHQCMMISFVYLLSASMFGVTTFVHVKAWVLLRAREQSVYDEISLVTFPWWIEAVVIFLVTGTLISLYFMYNVRHTEKA